MTGGNSTLGIRAISQRDRRLSLLGLFASVFAFAMVFGGMLPWMALVLESQGIGDQIIGLVSAAHPLGVLLAAPVTPRFMRWVGAANAMIWCSVACLAVILLLPIWEGPLGWFVLRFIGGLASAAPWVVTESWVNLSISDKNRGRVIALYASFMAGGFASGPLLLSIVGTADYAPFPWFVAISILSIVPLWLLRHLTPRFDDGEHGKLWPVFCALPAIMAASGICGALDSAFFSFLHIWGLRVGFVEAIALALITVFVAGNVLLQLPIGWLADRWGVRAMLLICGNICIAGAMIFFLVVWLDWLDPVFLAIVVFFWGGAAWGAYSLSIVAVGRRFSGAALTVANSGIVVAYTGASLTGPPLAGYAIEIWNPHGLLAYALVVGVAFTLLVYFRRSEGDPIPALPIRGD
jgi:MFS family permease